MMSLIILKLKIYKGMIVPIVIMTAMTLLFTYIFGSSFSGDYKPTVYIADEDQTVISRKIVEELLENDKYNFKENTLEACLNNVVEIDGIGVIHLPKGFKESIDHRAAKVYFYKQGESVEQMTVSNILQSMINQVVSDADFSKKLINYYEQKGVKITAERIDETIKDYRKNYSAIQLKATNYEASGEGYNSSKHYFSGFMLFFSMFIVTFGIGTIIDEKVFNVFNRVKISPLSTLKIIVANMIVNFFVGMGQLVFVVTVSHYIFDIHLGDNILAFLLILGAYVITGTVIGLFISVFVKTQSQLGALLPTLIVSTSMLGGCMWPLEIIDNKVLLFLANLTPQKWAIEGVDKVIIYNGGFGDITKPLMVLLLMTLIFTVATIIGYKRVET